MVDKATMRLTTGAAATFVFVTVTSLFLFQGVPETEVFHGLTPDTIEYHAREQFYYDLVGVKVKQSDGTYTFKRNKEGKIVTKGKVSRLQLFIEQSRTQFNNRDFKMF